VTGERGMRAIGLMLVDARLGKDEEVSVEIRGSRVAAVPDRGPTPAVRPATLCSADT
jgi:hypothetical protein